MKEDQAAQWQLHKFEDERKDARMGKRVDERCEEGSEAASMPGVEGVGVSSFFGRKLQL